MSNKTQVKCPQCGLLTFYSPENKARPFCSERCKLIDLGQWASEGYKIPVKSTSDYTSDLNPNEFDLNGESEDRADEDQ